MNNYDEVNALNEVAEFHRTFRHPVLNEPVIPAESRCRLRVALITEELEELETAIRNKDMVQIADALCDIQYVLSGAVLEFGLAGYFHHLFEEVHRSNMSKACTTKEEAEATINFYMENQHTECYFEKVNESFLVYRKADNKTLKSINYSKADLGKFLKM